MLNPRKTQNLQKVGNPRHRSLQSKQRLRRPNRELPQADRRILSAQDKETSTRTDLADPISPHGVRKDDRSRMDKVNQDGLIDPDRMMDVLSVVMVSRVKETSSVGMVTVVVEGAVEVAESAVVAESAASLA
jgi:hypothetical protein